ncbi:hypothetical protein KHU50_011388 [Colletotrichum sp. SAR 10_65]|nr:hypothetical protein KHU50_011388 [Colletotrichum sp. SAR 10_65]
MTATSSWHLLPPDLIEHQIGQIDLLMAMYPTEDEVTLDKDSSNLLDALKSDLETGSSNSSSLRKSPPSVTLLLNLSIPDSEDKTLPLDITVPFSHTEPATPDDPPHIKVRIQQPPWLSRAATTTLNALIPEDEDLFSTIEAIAASTSAHLSQAAEEAAAAATPSDPLASGGGPLVRVWFYFPSISTRSKRDDFIIHAPRYRLTGFLYAGKPGLLCLEGPSQNVDDYMRFIKTESWGDIPAHHKKVSERHREVGDGVERVFADMTEITDSLATPVPAPRTGAGKISGVNAYSTPYMIFCEKLSTQLKNSWLAGDVPNLTNIKRNTADTNVEHASVPRRPSHGDLWSTRYAASRLPGTPTADVMA